MDFSQIPASRSGVVRDGSIQAVRNRENDAPDHPTQSLEQSGRASACTKSA
jgi:hypothetical protein